MKNHYLTASIIRVDEADHMARFTLRANARAGYGSYPVRNEVRHFPTPARARAWLKAQIRSVAALVDVHPGIEVL